MLGVNCNSGDEDLKTMTFMDGKMDGKWDHGKNQAHSLNPIQVRSSSAY